MRAVAVVLLVLALGPAARAAASAAPAPWRWVFADEDDPKLARGAPVAHRWSPWHPAHDVPRFQLGYRRLWAAGIDGGTIAFDVGEIDYFPVSNLIRFGVDGEVGWGGGRYGLWYLLVGATLGVQWPARVTPFLEARFVAGLIGGDYQSQALVSWMYQGGIEGGIDVYYARRFFISAALGWTHPVYGGIDAAALMAHPGSDPVRKTLSADSLTIKVGLGL
jgi:hypothetical protein